ncbi:MAG: hypothetical protein AMJ54_15640 [Deltaproteobacteria bacterium SG8_13]|nr:MAG: hypothetical protein AMJ54_15640 [Deltaproteobacteria bacterium SG8_13]
MVDHTITGDIVAVRQLRRCMLMHLYAIFKQYPYAAVELKQIEEDCRSSTTEVNWNMVYLEKCGYVELGKAVEAPPYIASTATLTAAGIDLIEDGEEFDRRFPDHNP